MPRSVGNATEQNNAGSGKKEWKRTLFQLTFPYRFPALPALSGNGIHSPSHAPFFSILGQTSLLCRGGTPACRGNGLLQARGTGPHPRIGQAAQGIPDGLLPGKSRVSPARAAGRTNSSSRKRRKTKPPAWKNWPPGCNPLETLPTGSTRACSRSACRMTSPAFWTWRRPSRPSAIPC